jgi:hypothetical protein
MASSALVVAVVSSAAKQQEAYSNTLPLAKSIHTKTQ